MTDDLISRKILIEKLGISTECVDCQHKLNGLCLWKPNMVDVCEVITEMPSAQPEIIRCKDCKHWGIHKWLNIPWCREMHIDRGAEDFCSNAERRTDG